MYSLSEPYFKGTNPYEITVNVDGKPQVMELNTGAAVSVIGETQFREQFPEKELQDSCKYMQTYTGERVKITGLCDVDVHVSTPHGHAMLPLMVVPGQGAALIG